MIKILCFNMNDERIPFAAAWAKEHDVVVDFCTESLTMENVDFVNGYDGITVAQVGAFDSKIFKALESRGIKQIAQRTAGYEIFDLEAAQEANIIVTNVGNYSPESIAEYTLMLALQLMRKSHKLDRKVEARDFRWMPEIRAKLMGESTVAIIGVGKIGYEVAKLFKGFGARVIGYDPYPKQGIEDLITFVESIEEAVAQADIVSLHMPAFANNYHLFDAKMFECMNEDAYLINCGRGTLVDTEALLDAVDQNIIAGAALDVYEYEAPYIPGKFTDDTIKDKVFLRLLNHEDVIFYHHCAYYTETSIRNMTQFALDATLEIIRTGDSSYRVN
ncbi:D-2-hydroxyacid dehydrogenase [Erysipelothrix rhusiopathiae]|uniref:D-2-hydroxyacid dehydrogenase n=1 Tax=Erysipelothrix rhusiopathiae TaxID=1648 RepID=UPI00202B9879|nr:D-2-hydroxyacid dehydrogenase [Erysipelothrix rhusiopathiae]URQ77072.1 D-2-hydroxyacid dehydrogenase [Erysipelothrix rhusiopathiae]